MYQKTFVSLSFSATKLHAVLLSSNKKNVLKFGVLDIPQGLIVSYKVTDPDKLAAVIKSALNQFGIHERAVGIVVPEFSTYTRTISIPKLEYSEMDEAINWKMKDFLPEGGAQMVLDWKILRQTSDNCQVLVVSMLQESLQGFISAVEKAGLMPLVVETPALALARIASADVDPSIVLYSNSGEAVILALKENEILGSIVAGSSDQTALIRQTYQMVRHYQDLPIKKLYLGGLDISQSTMQTLQNGLKLPTQWLKLSLSGLTPPQIQDFLIPLSLGLVDPEAPNDENSVNLLPASWAKLYKDKRTKLQVWSLVLIASIVIWACLLTTMGAGLIIQRQIAANSQEQKEQSQVSPEAIARVNQANQLADDVIKITGQIKDPVGLVNTIAASKPAGVSVANYEINVEQGTIAISGVSVDRTSLVEFKNALEKIEDFGDIGIPLATLAQETNITFSFDFLYLPAVKPTAAPATKLKL